MIVVFPVLLVGLFIIILLPRFEMAEERCARSIDKSAGRKFHHLKTSFYGQDYWFLKGVNWIRSENHKWSYEKNAHFLKTPKALKPLLEAVKELSSEYSDVCCCLKEDDGSVQAMVRAGNKNSHFVIETKGDYPNEVINEMVGKVENIPNKIQTEKNSGCGNYKTCNKANCPLNFQEKWESGRFVALAS